jgi:hypothetical protein
VQLIAFVAPQFNCAVVPTVTLAGVTLMLTAGGGIGVAVTVMLDTNGPDGPVQVSVNVVLPASGPLGAVPLVAWGPLQPPLATQSETPCDIQLSVTESPMNALAGSATRFTIGGTGTPTMTVVEACAVPPLPVHESVKLNGPTSNEDAANVPDVACVPLHAPDAVQPVALVELQVRVVV